MAQYRVLISDPLAHEGIEYLERLEEIRVDYRPGLARNELVEAIAQADALIVRSGTQVDAELLRCASKLKAIARAGVGVDNIDLDEATRRGIIVMNTPGANTISTAEHTLALMLTLVRNIVPACESLRAGRWERSRFVGTQLAGKVLGVIGLGRVGMAVAKRALAFDMHVLAYDPYRAPERGREREIEWVRSLDELLERSDIITVHTPLTEQTRNMIGREQLARTKPGVRIINCARGGIVDEQALEQFLSSGHVAGAALDVFETEPPGDHPLLRFPNVVATPHLGASTREAQISVAVEAAQLVAEYLLHGRIRYAVNMPSVDRAELVELKYQLDMAYRLGLLQAQLVTGPIRRVRLVYRGEIARRNTRLMTTSFTAGLLQHALVESVNLVNAELLAQERGIELIEEKSTEAGDFATMIHTEVETDGQPHAAAGTIFGKQYLRIVRLDRFHLDAYLDGVLLIFRHRDVPGIIGYIGTIFGEQGVNIAAMNVGRKHPGGEAIAVLNLDSVPPPEAVEAVLAHPHIHDARVVKLPPPGEMPPWLRALVG